MTSTPVDLMMVTRKRGKTDIAWFYDLCGLNMSLVSFFLSSASARKKPRFCMKEGFSFLFFADTFSRILMQLGHSLLLPRKLLQL